MKNSLPNWIRKDNKGILTCVLCGYFVVQTSYNLICINLDCEKNYELPAEKQVNNMLLGIGNQITSTGTATSSSVFGSAITRTTTTTLLLEGGD
ncbi:MAG: hypothetical protein A2868_02625 [Candidatus Levybacteria bacterium RIFCSPHIGHO2_01_FULL_40_15b]|nr:MAG: hypothetical protein A2868_02625 [Candidatus Levybacteria bacterium RIFCSPHIGHO2_01_FULL_40_15b]